MTNTLSILTALALSSALSAQLFPPSSTLPRGEVQLNDDYIDIGTHGWGSWRMASPRELVQPGPAGTAHTANVAYMVYLDTDATGADVLQFRRTTTGGYSWEAARTIYTLSATEYFSAGETRLLAFEHEVYVVFAANLHTQVGGAEAVFVMGSEDQGQNWDGPLLVSTGMATNTLNDADEVNAAISSDASGNYVNIVFEADTPTVTNEDIFFVQCGFDTNGTLQITVPETRLNHAVPAGTTDVDFTSIAADGPVIHIAWNDDRAGGGNNQNDTFSMTSQANGNDFATVTELRHTTQPAPLSWAAPRRPHAAVDLPHVYTFMEHAINGQDDVWMDWSQALGTAGSWSPTVAINTATLGSGGDIDGFYVIADDGKVAVAYVDDRLNGANNNSNNQAVVAVSLNGGTDFVNGTHVEVPLGMRDPNPLFGIDFVGDLIAVLYETNCGGGEDIGISLSADNGQSFTHYDVTSFGGCGQSPGGVDVDDPRGTLTRNGDFLFTWIDDRNPSGQGVGNSFNNLYTTGIHWPQLLDRTGTNQGLRFEGDSPANVGTWVMVILSGTGTSMQWQLDPANGVLPNLEYDFWSVASIGGALATPPGPNNLNFNLVDLGGNCDFPNTPNPTTLTGLPFWATAITLPAIGPIKFTDPIAF